jgi:hypothetical protein
LAAIAIASQVLIGCGTSSTSFTPAAPSTASLNGNWYVTGNRLARQYPYLSVALIVDGNQIAANGDRWIPCSNVAGLAAGGSFNLTGQINSDGTFHLGEVSFGGVPNSSSIQVAIDGSAPTGGSSTWTGTYSVTDLAGYTSCIVNLTAPFAATALTPINATYAGTLAGSPGSAIISATIAQGAGISVLGPGGTVEGAYLPLSGTITVSGSPCFTHGTASATAENNQIEGDIGTLNFAMDDGSVLWLTGYFSSDESTMNPAMFAVIGGNCSNNTYNGTLTRQ